MIYDFKCEDCDEVIEVTCKLSERTKPRTCECGGRLVQQLGTPPAHFKAGFPGNEIKNRKKNEWE